MISGKRLSRNIVKDLEMDKRNYWVAFYFSQKIRFWERGEGREEDRERDSDLACNPGMFPDQESNHQCFGLWGDPQPTEPHQSEQSFSEVLGIV